MKKKIIVISLVLLLVILLIVLKLTNKKTNMLDENTINTNQEVSMKEVEFDNELNLYVIKDENGEIIHSSSDINDIYIYSVDPGYNPDPIGVAEMDLN